MLSARKIKQYQTTDGKVPFRDWLLAVHDVTVRARVRARLDRLMLGNFGDCRCVGQGVFELRFHFGPGYRIYFGLADQGVVILLLGGEKSCQEKDIRLAQGYWADYLRRRG